MKRSDGALDLDPAEFASPSVKRRSLHSIGGAPDFSIFDATDKPALSSTEKNSDMVHDTETQRFSFSSLRSSSLRRSTLQQRQGERSLFSREVAPGQISLRARVAPEHMLPQGKLSAAVESLGYFCRMRALRGAFALDANAGTTETKAISANGIAWWSLVGACLRQPAISLLFTECPNMIQLSVERPES